MANFVAPSGSWAPSTKRVTRTALPSKTETASSTAKRSGVVLALQEAQDGGVALDTGPRPSGRERSRHPRVSVTAVDAEHVGLVNT